MKRTGWPWSTWTEITARTRSGRWVSAETVDWFAQLIFFLLVVIVSVMLSAGH